MSRLEWGKVEDKTYETGVSHGVLFHMGSTGEYDPGVAWTGLQAINETPSGAEPQDIYADDTQYLSITSIEKFGCTIEAFAYPPEFEACNGAESPVPGAFVRMQNRDAFGLAYMTKIGNGPKGNDYSEKIHVVYGLKAAPSEQAHSTINESPEPTPMSWTCNGTPAAFKENKFKPTCKLDVRKDKLSAEAWAAIDKALFGDTESESRLPSPDEMIALMKTGAKQASETV